MSPPTGPLIQQLRVQRRMCSRLRLPSAPYHISSNDCACRFPKMIGSSLPRHGRILPPGWSAKNVSPHPHGIGTGSPFMCSIRCRVKYARAQFFELRDAIIASARSPIARVTSALRLISAPDDAKKNELCGTPVAICTPSASTRSNIISAS